MRKPTSFMRKSPLFYMKSLPLENGPEVSVAEMEAEKRTLDQKNFYTNSEKIVSPLSVRKECIFYFTMLHPENINFFRMILKSFHN